MRGLDRCSACGGGYMLTYHRNTTGRGGRIAEDGDQETGPPPCTNVREIEGGTPSKTKKIEALK